MEFPSYQNILYISCILNKYLLSDLNKRILGKIFNKYQNILLHVYEKDKYYAVNNTPKFGINLRSNKDFIPILVKCISEYFHFDYVIYNNQPYYERCNNWQTTCKKYRPSYDSYIECNGYSEECEAPPNIFPTCGDDVKYVLKCELIDVNELRDYFDINNKIKHVIDNMNKINNPDNVFFAGYDTITFYNPCGINRDHRGSNHCKIDLQFYNVYTIEQPITLHKLAFGLFRIKSHKWDKWYELYSECTFREINNTLFIRANFDHGS